MFTFQQASLGWSNKKIIRWAMQVESKAKKNIFRSSLFRDISQRRLVLIHGSFGTNIGPRLQGPNSPKILKRLYCPTRLDFNGYGVGSFVIYKTHGAWSLPLTSI